MLAIDFETRSVADLKKVDAWAYSLHKTTDVYCVVFGWHDAAGNYHRRDWQPGQPVPKGAISLSNGSWTPLAHNCSFERSLWMNVLTPKYGWPRCPAYWEDTQAHAASANLPVTLAGLGAALGVEIQKDKEGHALMLKMCVDRPGVVNEYDTPENRARLLEYCAIDVQSTLACYHAMPRMPERELAVWRLDQEINTRGLYIDRGFVAKLQRMAEARSAELCKLTAGETDFDLTNSTSTPGLKDWLTDQGVTLPKVARTRVTGEKHMSESIGKQAALELVAAGDLDPRVQAVLENRLEASKATSLAKLNKVEQLVDPRDGRLRNSLQFCAAHTGRWSSRGLQVHNFPRPKKGESDGAVREAVLAGDLQRLTELCNATA